MSRVTAWSYSRLTTYETCPRQFKFQVVDKVPQPKSHAMERGSAIHSELERYIDGASRALRKELRESLGPLLPEIVRLRKNKDAVAELEIAVDQRWRPVSWFEPAAWLRLKLDVREPMTGPENEHVHGTRLIDHKTGKERPAEHGQQLELYAVTEFMTNPKVDFVLAEAFYVDHGRKMGALFDSRQATVRLRKNWEARAGRMLRDTKYKPTPGKACQWCAFSRKKGGPCDAG